MVVELYDVSQQGAQVTLLNSGPMMTMAAATTQSHCRTQAGKSGGGTAAAQA